MPGIVGDCIRLLGVYKIVGDCIELLCVKLVIIVLNLMLIAIVECQTNRKDRPCQASVGGVMMLLNNCRTN